MCEEKSKQSNFNQITNHEFYHLKALTNEIESKNYASCYSYLSKIESIIEKNFKSDVESSITNNIFIIKNLKEDFFIQKQQFYFNIEQAFEKEFILIDFQVNEILIKIDKIGVEKLIDSLKEFFINDQYETLMSIFRKIFKNLSKNLISTFETMNKFSKLSLDETSSFLKIGLIGSNVVEKMRESDDEDRESDDNDDKIQQIEEKLKFIEKVLTYLNENLFDLNLKIKVSKVSIENLLKNEFKKLFLDAFFKFVYENLILKAIKLREYNMNKMLSLCSLIENFEGFLSTERIKFINANSDYENLLFKSFKLNIDNIYINRKCKYLLTKSRKLIKVKADLFETCLLDNESEASNLESVSIGSEHFNLNSSNHVAVNFIKFNKCKVSQLTLKIIRVVYETLDEAVKFEENCEGSCTSDDELNSKLIRNVSLLCLTAKNIIDLYSYVLPVYYKDEFQNLPLVAAVGFNDFQCMSYHCLTITHQYKSLLNKLNDSSIQTFVDLVPKLRKISFALLNAHISSHEGLLEEYLSSNNNGLANISESNNYSLFEKCLNRCQIQLVNLSNLWIKVLNKAIYLQIFGKFFNLICKNLSENILKLDDISADDASYLNKLMNIIRLAVAKIFGQNAEVGDISTVESVKNKIDEIEIDKLSISLSKIDLEASKYISLWIRFKYLCFILNAHLVDIVNLWAQSKGPLAEHFTKEEIRHLIKGLFMVTEKRTAALAEIN